MTQDLKDFLRTQSTPRESLLRYRFCYDMKLAAAKRGYDLKVYSADVDNDGSDVVFDDGDTVRKIQLKSVYGSSSRWDVHATMLKPIAREFEALDFIPQGTVGTGGAVVLQVITSIDPELNLEYHFTDIYLLRALEWGVVTRKPKVSSRAIANLADKVASARLVEKVKVSKSMFVQAKSADHLLALLSFHSPIGASTPFRHQVVEYGNQKFYGKDPSMMKAYGGEVRDQLVKCCKNLK